MQLSEQTMWQAVKNNDTTYDGLFFTCVKTTGIFCRPSCKARLPLRKNVEFVYSPQMAVESGYRACKRCHPTEHISPEAELIIDICRYIDTHAHEQKITLEQLGEQFHHSPYHLQRTFKRMTGITPHQYTEAVRLGEFKTLLREEKSVTEAIYAAGYTSASQIDNTLGMTPTEYQSGGTQHIAYAIADCPLGKLIVATTERGVCSVKLGDNEDVLIDEIYTEFPAAHIEAGEDDYHDAVATIIAHLEGRQPQINLPIDVKATAFQKLVWDALRKIPYGETRSYAQVAQSIGKPKAARAVGNACAKNPVALVIPCHRVTKGDGSVGNYRWGVQRKEELLQTERGNRH